MLAASNVIVTFKEYPHIDGGRRAGELFRLCVDAAAGQTKPAMGLFDCRMVNMFPTTEGPMAEFVAEMKAQEGRDGVLSLSLGHGFPWGDTADSGVRMLAVVDGDAAAAADVARRFGERFWSLREAVTGPGPDHRRGLRRGARRPAGPRRDRRQGRQHRRRRAGRLHLRAAPGGRARPARYRHRPAVGSDRGAVLSRRRRGRAVRPEDRRQVRAGSPAIRST